MDDLDRHRGRNLVADLPARRIYPKAPITEALIDLRVRYAPSIAFDQLKKFGNAVSSE